MSQTITITITDAEGAAVLAVTKEAAQAFLERNARAHVGDCVKQVTATAYVARGVPPDVAKALPADELEAVAVIREAKAAPK